MEKRIYNPLAALSSLHARMHTHSGAAAGVPLLSLPASTLCPNPCLASPFVSPLRGLCRVVSHNNLTGPVPTSTAGMGALKYLCVLCAFVEFHLLLFTCFSCAGRDLSNNEITGQMPASFSGAPHLRWISLSNNKISGTIPATLSELGFLGTLELAGNRLYGSIPEALSTISLAFLDVSRNYLTGRVLYPAMPGYSKNHYSSNFFSQDLQESDCVIQEFLLDANCFSIPAAAVEGSCAGVDQRPPAACEAFCGIVNSTTPACGGLGVCYPEGPNLVPTCLCNDGFVQDGGIYCIAEGTCLQWKAAVCLHSDSSLQNGEVVEAPTVLTKGAEAATAGAFTADPLVLFSYDSVKEGCGTQLQFQANFTFFMLPSTAAAAAAGQGGNGLAFVISATNEAGTGGEGGGVGYAGMDARSVAVEFDTFTDAAHGDMPAHHVGLNTGGSGTSVKAVQSPFRLNNRKAYTAWIDYFPGAPGALKVYLSGDDVKPDVPLLESPLSLCDVLQPMAAQRAFYFGFVASSVAPFQQQHAILVSLIRTALSATTFRPLRASPFTRYVSASYSLTQSGQQDAWLLRDPSSWDVPWLSWPVKDQDACNACWAFAVVASVEAAYGIAQKLPAPQLSVESLFAAMGLTTQEGKCSAGGSPTDAFEKLLALPKGGLTLVATMPASTSKTAVVKYYPVQGFERTRFKGYVGLMLAVERQPVLVHIEASAPTFATYDGMIKYQDPGCYTGRLNHVVLVIGYSVTVGEKGKLRIPPPFWIIRNSWGEGWGDRGHMRMDIQGGDGVCGINVLPGIYPIIKIPGDPCVLKGFALDREDWPAMNPCGRFACRPNARANTYSCTCSLPRPGPQPFVEVANADASKTCAYGGNPCAVGTCINDGKGSYSCICPPNYAATTTIDNFPTCGPADVTATTVAVGGDNWQCADVHPVMGLTLADFSALNKGVVCTKVLKKGTTLNVKPPSPIVSCTAFFFTLDGDTCDSIAGRVYLPTDGTFATLNPGVDCSKSLSPGRSLCLERNPELVSTAPVCLQYVMLTAQDTCERLLKGTVATVDSAAWAALYRNNPGLICSNTIPGSASAAGSNTGVQVCLRGKYWNFQLGSCVKGKPFEAPQMLHSLCV
ncbi:unnamed protein product [Closterium sp. NIES-65]|nr:unnamed protein product [Closterium sp. NIES-65]